MTESDLQRIESELGLKLPPRYRALALRLPAVDDDEAEDIASWYPFMDPDRVIERNRTLRENGWIDGSPWLSNLFCIGTFEGGDYFIDLTDLGRGVFYANTSGEPEWSPYHPDDYSDCWVHSFEVLENR